MTVQVARDVGTLWATLQPPADCTLAQRESLLLEVATASAVAHATWKSEQESVAQVLPCCSTLDMQLYVAHYPAYCFHLLSC